MRRDYRGREDQCVDEIVQGDLDDIYASRFVLVNATKPSWGTAMEIVYAHKDNKIIVAFTGDSRVSPWLRKHCRVFPSLEEAIDLINFAATCTASAMKLPYLGPLSGLGVDVTYEEGAHA